MWSPFTGLPAGAKRPEQAALGKGEKSDKSAASAKSEPDEINELKAQLASMQQKIDKLSQDQE